MTIGCILSHIYKHHTTILNPNSLASGADATLLWPLSLPHGYNDSCGARLLLEAGRGKLLDASQSHGPAQHD